MGSCRARILRGPAQPVLLSPSALDPRTGLPYQLRCDASGFAAGHSLWQLHTLPDETTLWRPI